MNYRQIETSRELRLWITQVIMPAFCVAMMIPETREAITTKAKEVKAKIENRLHN